MTSPLALAWAVGATIVASYRVTRHEARLDLPDLVARLRRTRRWPHWLAEPSSCQRVSARLARWVPPRGMGICLKRSLLLLDLWSRCGLVPRLHLGLQHAAGGDRMGHAWVTADTPDKVWSAGNPAAAEITVI